MSIFDRIYDGLRSQVQLRADIDRASARLDRVGDDILDHEKRLIRLETLVEIAQQGAGRRLPRD